MEDTSRSSVWPRRLAVVVGVLVVGVVAGRVLLARADGPFFIFAGGPFRSGEPVALADLDWEGLDGLNELELEIVGEASSLTLWFSVSEGVAYVACDLDCLDGRLARWPRHIERDARVVVRIDGRRADARLTHVPHGSEEYALARADRERKYAGDRGARSAAESVAHDAVVDWGEALTGRAGREEPGDRLYRVDPR